MILDIIHHGYKIKFMEIPLYIAMQNEIKLNNEESDLILKKVKTLFDKEAIEIVILKAHICLTFLYYKKEDGRLRPVSSFCGIWMNRLNIIISSRNMCLML